MIDENNIKLDEMWDILFDDFFNSLRACSPRITKEQANLAFNGKNGETLKRIKENFIDNGDGTFTRIVIKTGPRAA